MGTRHIAQSPAARPILRVADDDGRVRVEGGWEGGPPDANVTGSQHLSHPGPTGGERAIQQFPQRVAASIPIAPHAGHSRSCGAGPSASVSTSADHAVRSAGEQSPSASCSSTHVTALRNPSRGSRRVLLLVVVMTPRNSDARALRAAGARRPASRSVGGSGPPSAASLG